MTGTLVITGASRGIGAATARLAASRGWRVVGSYLERRDPAEAVIADIRAAGGEAIAVQADTSKEEDVIRLFDSAEREFGPVRGVVNNAGINGGPMKLADMSTAELRAMIDTNVYGALLCAREAVRRMATDRGAPGRPGLGGALVNIGSVAARLGSPGERIHYAASKGAVISMSHGLAKEVIRSGVRVNCVSPGLTETDMNPADRLAVLVPNVPIARVASPDEIARVILFLLSDESSYMVGVDLTVSGGR